MFKAVFPGVYTQPDAMPALANTLQEFPQEMAEGYWWMFSVRSSLAEDFFMGHVTHVYKGPLKIEMTAPGAMTPACS
jgi:hypothetical protein